MNATITEDRLTQAAQAAERLSARQLYDCIAQAVLAVRPDADPFDTKAWAELVHGQGFRKYGERFTVIFLEEPPDKAEAIINALCQV